MSEPGFLEIDVKVRWIHVSQQLPPMNQFVMIYRTGGINNHHDVGIGYRRHKWGTPDEWDWCLTDPLAIEKKMAINRARKWKLNGDGTGQHE